MIKSEETGEKLLQSIGTLHDAAIRLYGMAEQRSDALEPFAETMEQLLFSMQAHLDRLHQEDPNLMAHLICRNVVDSLNRLLPSAGTDSGKACRKIRFELLPLIEELYVDLRFWGFCYPDRDRVWEYYRDEMPELCPLPAPEDGRYRYEVSVVIVAYNKVEYTKLCLEYYERYFPKDVSHELILFNNGSDDGTKELFESVHPDKQIDIRNNTKSWSIIGRVAEGRYLLTISNDVLLLPHAAENLLACIGSDESICCVAPTCPNIANLQTVPVSYRSPEEMVAFAEKNNVRDPYRWEQRARLNPPVLLGRSDSPAVYAFFTYWYPVTPARFLAFSDDLMGLIARRDRQKCVLAKDAYVHHFGSVTVSGQTHQNEGAGAEFYNQRRKEFAKIFDLDPWSAGLCFDPELIASLRYEKSVPVDILGIDCGIGDTPLKIKAMLREKMHNLNVRIYNIADNPYYSKDLAGLSDGFQLITDWQQLGRVFPGVRFGYIVADGVSPARMSEKLVHDLFARLAAGGMLAVKNKTVSFRSDKCLSAQRTEHWQIFQRS